MTRKDYVTLAASLAAEKPGRNWDPNKHVQWENDVRAIAGALAADNARFNRNKFYEACGFPLGATD